MHLSNYQYSTLRQVSMPPTACLLRLEGGLRWNQHKAKHTHVHGHSCIKSASGQVDTMTTVSQQQDTGPSLHKPDTKRSKRLPGLRVRMIPWGCTVQKEEIMATWVIMTDQKVIQIGTWRGLLWTDTIRITCQTCETFC